jgi:hypothetical protein
MSALSDMHENAYHIDIHGLLIWLSKMTGQKPLYEISPRKSVLKNVQFANFAVVESVDCQGNSQRHQFGPSHDGPHQQIPVLKPFFAQYTQSQAGLITSIIVPGFKYTA